MTIFIVILAGSKYACDQLGTCKAHLSALLDAVEGGEELVITRHGRPVARVSPAFPKKEQLPLRRLAQLRQQLPKRQESSAEVLRDLRIAE